MPNRYIETGTIFRGGDLTNANGNEITHAVRKAVADHRRLLQGPHGNMAGRRIITLGDGTTITTWVNPYGLAPTLMARVVAPPSIKPPIEYVYACGFIFAPVRDTFPYSPTSPGDIRPLPQSAWHNYVSSPTCELSDVVFIEDTRQDLYGNVDWISPLGEVVSFWGPESRYFYTLSYTGPGGEARVWDYAKKQPNKIFINGTLLEQYDDIYAVNGVGILSSIDDARRFLLFATYTIITGGGTIEIYSAELFKDEITYSLGDKELLATIDLADSPAASWYYTYMYTPSTITTFNFVGTEGSCVLHGGDIVTMTFTHPGAIGVPTVSSAIERFTPVGQGKKTVQEVDSVFGQYEYSVTGSPLCPAYQALIGGGNTLQYIGTQEIYEGFVEGLRTLDTYNDASVTSLYDMIDAEWIRENRIAGIDDDKRPLAIDYVGTAKKTAYISSPSSAESGSISFSLAESVEDEFMHYAGYVSCNWSSERFFLYMPNRERIPMKDTVVFDASYRLGRQVQRSGPNCTTDIWPAETGYAYKAREDVGYESCIRYMDLRHNALHIAYGAMTSSQTTKSRVAQETLYNYTETVIQTSETEAMSVELLDKFGSVFSFTSGIDPTSETDTTTSTIFVSGNGAPPINAILAAQPDPVDTLDVNETESVAFVPSALNTFIFGQATILNQPDAADGNPSAIAYSCNGSRLFSLQGLEAKEAPQDWNSYWDTSSWTNRWTNLFGDEVCDVDLTDFVTVVPEEGGYVRLQDVAPISISTEA